jgi:glucoside 3-dehydrogenase (cytochrome c) catalytic subunit
VSSAIDKNTYDARGRHRNFRRLAAKELTDKGLKALVLDRGHMVRQGEYPITVDDPWKLPHGSRSTAHDRERQPKQARTGYAVLPESKHWFVDDIAYPYEEKYRFDWIREIRPQR